MTHVLEINDLNFDREVLQSDRPFLLDFTAAWCGPCKALAPILEELAAETAGAVRVGKLDIDGSPDVATRLGVRGAPTLVVFRDGKEVKRRIGAGNKRTLRELVGGV